MRRQPDWKTAPAWAKWWAKDENGDAFWYEVQPQIHPHSPEWQIVDPDTHLVEYDYKNSNRSTKAKNWQNSLHRRPTT